jgi:hypothetical protein
LRKGQGKTRFERKQKKYKENENYALSFFCPDSVSGHVSHRKLNASQPPWCSNKTVSKTKSKQHLITEACSVPNLDFYQVAIKLYSFN